MVENNLVRDEVRRIAPYNAGLTIAEVARRYSPSKISKLGSNENPFGPSPHALDALARSCETVHLYPDPTGSELRGALANRHGVEREQIILGNGSEDLLSIICKATLRPDDRMLTLYPSFPLHEDYTTVMGARVERVMLRRDLTIDVDSFGAAAGTEPRIIMFANPMNPVGSWLDRNQLENVFLGVSDSTLVVVDEAYAEYAIGPDYAPASDVLRGRRNCIALRTFSKAWGLAGLRIGYAIVGSKALAAFIDRVRTPFNASGPAQASALAALGDEQYMLKCVAETLRERERVHTVLKSRGLLVGPSKGNFLFVDVRRDALEVSEMLLNSGVIVKPWKQEGYRTFLRTTIGTVAENNHFLEALSAAL